MLPLAARQLKLATDADIWAAMTAKDWDKLAAKVSAQHAAAAAVVAGLKPILDAWLQRERQRRWIDGLLD